MATLTKLESRLAEVLGLAVAAQDVFEFLTMAEAGEVGHWSIVATLNEKAGNADLQTLCKWALPIQQRHVQAVLDGSLKPAADEDPDEEAS